MLPLTSGAMAAEGLTTVALGGATESANATVTLFRGVGAAEAGQVARTTTLETTGASAEGAKFFTNTYASAAEWARRLHGEAGKVIEVTMSRVSARTMDYLGRIDGIGEAWVGRLNEIKDAVAKVIE